MHSTRCVGVLRKPLHRGRAIAVMVGVLACASVGACGGGSDGKVAAGSLKSRLLPPSFVPGYRVQRTLDWSDPVDLVGEGMRLPEATHPSDAVRVVNEAGLRGAAGEILTKGQPPEEDHATSGVVRLKSAAGARKLRDYMHRQDLIQPCFTACIYQPGTLEVVGVPGAVAVQQVPHLPAPPGGGSPPPESQGPPVGYAAEFTIGPYLYFATTDGRRRDAARFVATTRRYYQRVKKLGG
jgi:hypothetical protein